jgi:hypothetical protein
LILEINQKLFKARRINIADVMSNNFLPGYSAIYGRFQNPKCAIHIGPQKKTPSRDVKHTHRKGSNFGIILGN